MEKTLIKLKETREAAELELKDLNKTKACVEKSIARVEAFLASLPSADSLIEGDSKPAQAKKARKAKTEKTAEPSTAPVPPVKRVKRGALKDTILSFASMPRSRQEIIDHVKEAGVLNMNSKNPINSVNQILYGKHMKKSGDLFVAAG